MKRLGHLFNIMQLVSTSGVSFLDFCAVLTLRCKPAYLDIKLMPIPAQIAEAIQSLRRVHQSLSHRETCTVLGMVPCDVETFLLQLYQLVSDCCHCTHAPILAHDGWDGALHECWYSSLRMDNLGRWSDMTLQNQTKTVPFIWPSGGENGGDLYHPLKEMRSFWIKPEFTCLSPLLPKSH